MNQCDQLLQLKKKITQAISVIRTRSPGTEPTSYASGAIAAYVAVIEHIDLLLTEYSSQREYGKKPARKLRIESGT